MCYPPAMPDPLPSRPTNPHAPKVSLTKAFSLFCQGYAYNHIAKELGCHVNTVALAAKRGDWTAKRARLAERFPSTDPLNQFNPVGLELIQWQQSELERVTEAEDLLRADLRTCFDPEVRVKVSAALIAIGERRRIALGIPLPGSRRPQPEVKQKRGVVSGLDPRSITDVLEPQPPGGANGHTPAGDQPPDGGALPAGPS